MQSWRKGAYKYPADQIRHQKLTEEWGRDYCGRFEQCVQRDPCEYHQRRAATNGRDPRELMPALHGQIIGNPNA